MAEEIKTSNPPVEAVPAGPVINTSTGDSTSGPAGSPKAEPKAKVEPKAEEVDPWDPTVPGDASKQRQEKMLHGDNHTGEPARNDSAPEVLLSGMPDDPLRNDEPWSRLIHGDPK